MVCKNCGKEILDDSISFCPNCNSYLKEVDSSSFSSYTPTTYPSNPIEEFNNMAPVPEIDLKPQKEKKKINFNKVVLFLIVVVMWGLAIYFLFLSEGRTYFFKDDFIKASPNDIGKIDPEMANYEAVSKSGQTAKKSKIGVTSIVYDNQYLKQTTLKDINDVYRMIATDSLKQKNNCSQEIVEIENRIVSNYGFIAMNLCEMDTDFALELEQVIKYIYDQYPSARNHMTNMTLANVDSNASFMAAFMPIFTFATSNTKSGYPVGIKTQIILNAKYFLNTSKMESSVSYGAKSGYFPPNATRSSAVAHEFGHYLSYVALMNHYASGDLTFVKNNNSKLMVVYDDFNAGTFSYHIVDEAYAKYKQSAGSNMSFDEFRGSISKYAIAKDGNGEYIYDETIAEAFHDCYLNGEDAKLASKLIFSVLMSYI